MYIVDIKADKYFHRLSCDFRTFLDRFIMTYGSTFWEWGAVSTNIRQSVPEPPTRTHILPGVNIFTGP